MSSSVLTLKDLRKSFHQGPREIKVLNGIDLELTAGKSVALIGPSGSGKSTLLHIAGLLDGADGGDVLFQGDSINGKSDKERTELRGQHIGFVFQFHHLLPEFTALENVMMALILNGTAPSKAKTRASELLNQVGLKERLDHTPAQLSGGEQQRVAIARALANSPALLLADEPTGNLDTETSATVFDLIQQLVKEHDMAALIATHNPDLAAQMDKTVSLKDGKVA